MSAIGISAELQTAKFRRSSVRCALYTCQSTPVAELLSRERHRRFPRHLIGGRSWVISFRGDDNYFRPGINGCRRDRRDWQSMFECGDKIHKKKLPEPLEKYVKVEKLNVRVIVSDDPRPSSEIIIMYCDFIDFAIIFFTATGRWPVDKLQLNLNLISWIEKSGI